MVAVVALALVIAGTGAAYYVHTSKPTQAAASLKPKNIPLNVVATTPSSGSSSVAPDTTVTVDLTTALSPLTPLPSLSPAITGTWGQASPTELVFSAAGPLVPGATETLTVPGGPTGLEGAQGQRLPASVTSTFTVAPGSTLRLQQLLAELGYLPVTFIPTTSPTSPQELADPQAGNFSWRWSGTPAALTSLWTQGTDNVITRGAVMAFEEQNGLTTDGLAGAQVWTDLLAAAQAGTPDPQPYDYVYVSKNLPETTTVYRNGAVAYSTLANTGVPGAPTADGTFPVYLRYLVTTMSGTNPDGSKYSDPGIPWVSYFNGGDALHGFVRGGYGYPQSDGCVEMPPANAAVVYPLTPIGTLVTVA